MANIKAHLAAKEPYFESLIRRYFLENLHRATVILTPDPNLAAVQAEAEAGRVKAVLASLPETKRAAHAAKAERLQALQQIARQA